MAGDRQTREDLKLRLGVGRVTVKPQRERAQRPRRELGDAHRVDARHHIEAAQAGLASSAARSQVTQLTKNDTWYAA
jgi:hypothetical protein